MGKYLFPVIIVTALLATSIDLAARVPRSARQGEELFVRYCTKCHGVDGVGQDAEHPFGGWRLNGTRIAPALNGTAHSFNHSPKELFEHIKKGPIDRTSSMRAFKDVLDNYQIVCLIFYIKSLWPDEIKKEYDQTFKR